ncbi:hypothetical protein [Streptomyces sp. NRRL S-813]|uniref:hypothetical protein n=1 Tax=Streptomyces sp. NRRL S-813 TaxID=1463919 RepID=UPI0004C14050|nr:hypothetical protein [Streptomyces sp. NRRL S-813]
MARFAREAAVAGGLAHPNIVTVHDFGFAAYNGQTCAYLVMELLPGQPLSSALQAGRLPLPKALKLPLGRGHLETGILRFQRK